MTVKKAVAIFEKYHQQAQDTNKMIPGFIKNPVAWALYQAWREADKADKKVVRK